MSFQTTPTHRIYFECSLAGCGQYCGCRAAGRAAWRGDAGSVATGPAAWPRHTIEPHRGVEPSRGVHGAALGLSSRYRGTGSGDLSPVTVNDLPSEVSPIAQAVNRLMDKLKRALEAERSFTANSAHELRTPIAAALAQTQRLIAETQDKAARDRGEQIEAALHRLSRLRKN